MTTTPTRRRAITPSIYSAVLSEGRCTYCGLPIEDALVVDHVIPFSRGGSDDPENLTAACFRCNAEKSDLTPAEWRGQREAKGRPWPPPNMLDVFTGLLTSVMTDELAERLEGRHRETAEVVHEHAKAIRNGAGFAEQRDRLAGLLRGGGVA